MNRAWLIACGRLLFRYRDYLFPAVFLVLIVTTRPEFPFGSVVLDRWMDAFGFGVACLGEASRLLAVGSVESIRRGGDRKQIAAARLIRAGVFACTRNPLYLGNLLIVTGLVLIANSFWWYALVLPGFAAAYWAIVLAEEEFLARRFGAEYAAYLASVNRFVPRFGELHRALEGGHFDWRRAATKEVTVICSWLAMALVLVLGEERKLFGSAEWQTRMPQLLVVGLMTLFAFRAAIWWRRS